VSLGLGRCDSRRRGSKKTWNDIWGCGHGIGAVKAGMPAGELVARPVREYAAARVCGC